MSGLLSGLFLTGTFFILAAIFESGLLAAIFIALINAVLPLVIRALTLVVGEQNVSVVLLPSSLPKQSNDRAARVVKPLHVVARGMTVIGATLLGEVPRLAHEFQELSS